MCLNPFQESNGPSDAYAAISNADRLQAEPESLRKWREEQRERLELLGEHYPIVSGVTKTQIRDELPFIFNDSRWRLTSGGLGHTSLGGRDKKKKKCY